METINHILSEQFQNPVQKSQVSIPLSHIHDSIGKKAWKKKLNKQWPNKSSFMMEPGIPSQLNDAVMKVFSMTYHRVCNQINMTGATSEAVTANPSGAPEFSPGLQWGWCYSILCFICPFCRSLFVLLSFFFWSLCCLFFFDIRFLITSLVSSNSSSTCKSNVEIIGRTVNSVNTVTKSKQ